MKDLEQIISALSKEEIRFYKLFINRTNSSKNKQRKDVELLISLEKEKQRCFYQKILNKLSISNSNNYYH